MVRRKSRTSKPRKTSLRVIDAKKPDRSNLRTAFFRVGADGFAGYVVDEADLSCRFVVEMLLDGYPVQLARADAYMDELGVAGIGDGCYGFYFTVPPATIADGLVAESRVANSGTLVGQTIQLRAASNGNADPQGPGMVRWLGGLRFEGWCQPEHQGPAVVTAIIDGETVAEVKATRWTHFGGLDNAKAVPGFDLHLPPRFADGRVRRARFVREDGRDIASSPIAFVAYPDGLERTLARLGEAESERLRGEMFDRLVPASLPFTEYASWRARFPVGAEASVNTPIAVVMIGPGDDKVSLESIEAQAYPDWVAAALPEADEQTEFAPAMLQAFLAEDAAACEFGVFMLAGTRLATAALQRLANGFAAYPNALAAYGDVEIETGDGTPWPIAFPAFDYERLLEQGYCAYLFAMRRSEVERLLAAGASNLHRLFNMQMDRRGDAPESIIHLPGALGTLPRLDLASACRTLAAATKAHLRARGLKANVEPATGATLPAVRVARVPRNSSTTIVIPVRNKPALLRACLDSIRPAAAAANAEILVVDNESSDPEMLDFLDQLDERRVLVLRVPGPFNFARLNNIAAEKAYTDNLLLLNNDIKALDATWLPEMLSRLVDGDVGAVGALLLWPSGVVQHGGVVLGPAFAALHAFNDCMQGDPGYGDMLRIAHECSAVTAACLLIRRRDYLDVGGMDELRFPVNFNDVDLCLKLRAAGKRIVLTPHAQLLHHESATRGSDVAPDRASRFARELGALRARWGDVLADDPYYSPILSLDPAPFSALAWPPRDCAPRLPLPPVATEIPPGF